MIILLTGASGMVGRNILEHDAASNYSILKPSSSDLNLLNVIEVQQYLKKNKPDIIIHAAGFVGGIQSNIAQPIRYLIDNIHMGFNLINVAKEEGIKKFLNLASSCIYPKNGQNPLTEDLILTGELEPTNEAYALAKIAVLRLCEFIHREKPIYQYKSVIPCNLYGRFDDFSPEHSHMIPAAIKKISDAKKGSNVSIWGNGQARREFMYASDLADFIFYAIRKFEDMPQNINVGLGVDYSIKKYYQEIAKVIGFKGKFIHDLSKPTGMTQKLISTERLNKFGWSHKTQLKDGLAKTYKFYQNNLKND